jgi:hypothetical protein
LTTGTGSPKVKHEATKQYKIECKENQHEKNIKEQNIQ